jgi:pre-mRNA-processing factor 6
VELTPSAKEQQELVVKRCSDADPHHGTLWQPIAKDLANAGLDTRALLPKVVAALPTSTGW